jgi:hypothetical protein
MCRCGQPGRRVEHRRQAAGNVRGHHAALAQVRGGQVTRPGMRHHAGHGRGPAIQALSQQGTDHAGQNVTRAGCRHARVAERTDRVAAGRIRDHGATALEHCDRAVLFRQALGRRYPILLHFARRATQQAAGFGRMRGQHPAATQRLACLGLPGQEVEAVGVEHDR